jgi:hypothetical protein
LALLGDPFVAGQSGFWADHLIADKALTVESRLDSMFRAALGRWRDGAERARFTGLAKEVASLRQVTPDKLLDSRDVWKDVAHAIFNLKEFIYLR